ncbi:MAG: acetyl-CoA carboxylase carboxyltransferase subunit alpha [Defluviitaleaceae bacterium]|nr:acetyl-CoA carboxylase carboxyltransferase subunit alpha [Defluviitaleaceae bacterium]
MTIQELELKIKEIELEASQVDKDTKDAEQKKLEILSKIRTMEKEVYKNLTPWDKVYLARHPLRPNSIFYIHELFNNFVEFCGDRYFADDKAITGGIANFKGIPVTILAQTKGKTLEDNLSRNFGMPNPEGYRKTLRLAKQAEKFGRPIITFIDTPGAYPGMGAEERGQAEAIARNLMEFMELEVPIIAIVIGEGGSGGALALTVSDHIIMLENSIYSILSPEGFASILWKDAAKASEAAALMKLTAQDLYNFKIIDTIIKEPVGGIHKLTDYVMDQISIVLSTQLDIFAKMKKSTLLQNRYKKFRDLGKDFV